MNGQLCFTEKNGYRDTGNKLVLYHGSKKGITGEIAPISREECDFGSGFYMGTSPLQPLTLVCNEDKPKFYTVELDMTGLRVLTVEIGMDWAMLIAYYRKEMESAKETVVYEKYAHMADGYDVIIGYIANDRMYTSIGFCRIPRIFAKQRNRKWEKAFDILVLQLYRKIHMSILT